MTSSQEAKSWSLPGVLDYFENHRNVATDVYPSESFFLDVLLTEGISVLDVGCAVGGFATIVASKLGRFSYTGIDISPAMIARAKTKHPEHEFFEVRETDFSVLGDRRFDLVLCLGILHLNERWEELIAASWNRTGRHLLLDLRETHLPTLTDRAQSYFKMDFGHLSDSLHSQTTLPFNIINSGDALVALHRRCPEMKGMSRFGYTHTISRSAVSPIQQVMMTTYCIERRHE